MAKETEETDFADFIREYAHGSTNKMATERMRELVAACRETGSKGSITVKFTIDTKNGLAEVRAAISCKKPEPGLPGAHYYTNEAGELLDEDPRQMKLAPKILDQKPARVINIQPTEER